MMNICFFSRSYLSMGNLGRRMRKRIFADEKRIVVLEQYLLLRNDKHSYFSFQNDFIIDLDKEIDALRMPRLAARMGDGVYVRIFAIYL